MQKIIIFISLFYCICSQASSVDILASCKLQQEESEESIATYSILRDGDRLFGRYRLNEGRDLEETDDVFVKKYEGESLSRLKEAGILDELLKQLKLEEEKVEKVTFFGMVEIEDEDDPSESPDPEKISFLLGEGTDPEDPNPTPAPKPPKYLMEIYKVSGTLGVSTGYVGRPLGKPFYKCQNSGRFKNLF